MFLVVVLYAVLALTFVLAKQALSYASPFFLIGFRMILAGSILLGYQYVFRRHKFVIKKADWWLFFRVALFHIYFSFMLEFWALQYLSALKTTLIYSATPFIAAILSYVLLKEGLSWRKGTGIVVGLGGLIPVIMANTGKSGASELAHIALPEVVLGCAVISGSYAWFLVKRLMDRDYSLIMINGVAMLVGGILSMGTAGVVEGFAHPVSNWGLFLFWIILLIIAANVIVYNLYGSLMRHYSITFISFAGFLCPSFGTLYEWLLTGGTVTWHYLVSLALVTLGLYIFYGAELSLKKSRS